MAILDFEPDHYQALGIDRGSEEKEIKKQYRRLARLSHPDVNPGDKAAEERFKVLNEAWQVLGDPDIRERYDLFKFGGKTLDTMVLSFHCESPLPASPGDVYKGTQAYRSGLDSHRSHQAGGNGGRRNTHKNPLENIIFTPW